MQSLLELQSLEIAWLQYAATPAGPANVPPEPQPVWGIQAVQSGQVTVCPQTSVLALQRPWQSGSRTELAIEAQAPAWHHSPLGQGPTQV